MSKVAFDTVVQAGEAKNVTGIVVPEDAIAALGKGKRPRVKVTLNGYGYTTTIGGMGGTAMISLSAAHRTAAGLSGGDAVHVTLELDTEPQQIEIPAALQAALDQAGLSQIFGATAPSARKEWARQVSEAKAPDTRQRRIEKILAALETRRP